MNINKVAPLLLIIVALTACTAYRHTNEHPSSNFEKSMLFLASDELSGRYPGTQGDLLAAEYIEKILNQSGLETGRQEFSVVTSVKKGITNSFSINNKSVENEGFSPFGFSSDTSIKSRVIFCGYGLTVKADSFEWDDYKGIDAKGKWVLAMRGSPEIRDPENYLSMASDDRDKAMLAADNGAAGLILVSGPEYDPEDKLIEVNKKMASVGIPVFHVSRHVADTILKAAGKNIGQLEKEIRNGKTNGFNLETIVDATSDIDDEVVKTYNIYGILRSSNDLYNQQYIVIGAHYDHLGKGGAGSSSRRQDMEGVHNGADDNASGVSLMIEMAGRLKQKQQRLKRSYIFAAFGAEEMGLLGSKYFVNHMPVEISSIDAMINLDMVGRLDTAKGIQIGGTGTSAEADSLIKLSNTAGLKLRLSREGSGPSDHSSFYGKNIPVFFITSGAHNDYHTPDDDVERINFSGMALISDFTENLLSSIDTNPARLTFSEAGPKQTASGPGYRFKVTLGFMPDFSSTDIEGVRVDFVSKGKAAERGGIKNGDIITAIDGLPVKNIYDYMYRLGKLSKNQIISVEILRGNTKEVLLIQL